jgi:hypothetical protein
MTLRTLASIVVSAALLVPASAAAQGAKKDAPKKEAPKKEEPAPPAKEEPKKEEPKKEEPPPAAAGPYEPRAKETTEPPAEKWDISDVAEAPGKNYTFIGLRYRGNIVPRFMINLFVDEGKTVYSNTIGIELDLRKDGFSLIPALSYTELGTGDILFKEKNSTDIAGNYSLVNSGMKVLYATADLLWSTPMGKNVSFEYGAGFGLGVVFGDLVNNWVQADPNGQLQAENGQRFSRCQVVGPPGTGCNRADHQNSDVDKVADYNEKSWLDGGSKPVLFPWIAVPQIGIRYKPIKQFVGRLGLGFSLTGFWFGLSGQYGLEQQHK